MKYKTFKYQKYKNCYFIVENYYYDKDSMAITILNNEEGAIADVTVNMNDYFYAPNTATIKNYSENAGMTKFLKNLGIIEELYSSRLYNPLAQKSETIDYCLINIDKLKEYTKRFDYKWELKSRKD